MKKTARLLCLLLAVLLVAFMAASCTKDDAESSAPSGQTSGTDEGGFPLEEKKWDTTINIITHSQREHTAYEFGTNEMTGESVNDAFYERTALIEERYGLSVNVTRADVVLGGATEEIENQVLTGGNTYDLVADGVYSMARLGINEIVWDFNEIDNGYLHLDADYWDQTAVRDLSMGGKLFYITGDAIVSDDSATWVMYYNKSLINEIGLENPVDLVDSGNWTVEKLYEMCRDSALQVGEGASMSYDPSVGDRWGMVAQAYDGLGFMWGAQQPMVTKDENDLPIIRIGDEQNINAWNDIIEMLLDKTCVGVADLFGPWNGGVYDQQNEIFCNGNAVFMPGAVYKAETVLNESGIEYGVLPMPKANVDQEDYSSASTVYWATFFSIPTSNVGEKLDATCYLLEAMAYWGQEMCAKEYFDEALKLKYFNDEDSERMLDLIFNNRTYDLAAVFDFAASSSASGMIQFYTRIIGAQGNAEIVSLFEGDRDRYQQAIDELVAKFQQ